MKDVSKMSRRELRGEVRALREAIEKLELQLEATESQAIAEGRIVHKCNDRIEKLEAIISTAVDRCQEVILESSGRNDNVLYIQAALDKEGG